MNVAGQRHHMAEADPEVSKPVVSKEEPSAYEADFTGPFLQYLGYDPQKDECRSSVLLVLRGASQEAPTLTMTDVRSY
jgi:hypothetical protein